MADDDIEKLLREIDAMNQAQRPGATPPAQVAKASTPEPARPGGRGAWAGASAVGGLVVGGAAGTVLWFLPYVSTVSTAIGAALGGAAIGLVSRPPDWFSKRR
jgi:predicted lipid-binding transport protein (Tim44 family)